MIQPNELRIGNWAIHNNPLTGKSVYHQVTVGTFSKLTFHAREYEPILLTPELLEKCGFVNGGYHDGGDSSWGHPDFPFKLTNNDGAPGFSVYYYDDNDCVYPADVDYLHQLQNLYFCLTGKELPVKL